MSHHEMMRLMIKTGTSKNDLMFNCGIPLITIKAMMSGKIPVGDSIKLFLNTRLGAMDES